MFTSTRNQTTVRSAMLALAAAVCACSPAAEAAMGPAEPGGPAADIIHLVRVRMDSITVMGSCDHNSIFESSEDGEFIFRIAVITTDVVWGRSVSGTYKEGLHALNPASAWTASLQRIASAERKVPELQDFSIEFHATEKDGVLGSDPAMNTYGRAHVQWSPSQNKFLAMPSIEVKSGDKCGVRLRFTITSAPV